MKFDPRLRHIKTRTTISIHSDLMKAAVLYGEANPRATGVPLSFSEIIGKALVEYLSSRVNDDGVPYLELPKPSED